MDTRETVIALRKDGKSYLEIAEQTGKTRSAVAGILDRAGLRTRTPRPILSAETYNRVLDLWAAGGSQSEIAGIVGKTKGSVKGIIERARLVLNDPRAAPKPIVKSQRKRKPRPRKERMRFERKFNTTLKSPPSNVWNPLEGSSPVNLIELKSSHCRWPLWGMEPGLSIAERPYCGDPVQENSSYCPCHYQFSIGRGTESERKAGSTLLRFAA